MEVVKWRIKRLIRDVFPAAVVRKLFDPETATQHLWSIGIYTGSSPCRLKPSPHIRNPVLTRNHIFDVRALFVADPFMICLNSTWYMFFEVYNYDTARGEIGLATSRDGLSWSYQRIVLRESFHLSYPYVFEADGRFYMIPESHEADSVRLYESSHFPYTWVCKDILLSGQRFSDSSLFRYDNLWWLFSETSPTLQHDTLRLFFSPTLCGPWREHPASPIIHDNPHIARPAGRVIMWDNNLIRFTQDCLPVYGTRVHAFKIVELSCESYRETPLSPHAILSPGYRKWNVGGMHHLDLHQTESSKWVAVVDGWRPVWQLVPDEWRISS